MTDVRPSAPVLGALTDDAKEIHADLVALRRELHQWPELGNFLPVTRGHVLGANGAHGHRRWRGDPGE